MLVLRVSEGADVVVKLRSTTQIDVADRPLGYESGPVCAQYSVKLRES